MRNMLRAVSVITGTLILLLAGIVVPQSVSAGALVQQNTQAIDPEVASAIAENERTSELYSYWIAFMTPFVSQNPDGTYTCDDTGLVNALRRDHPELFRQFKGHTYPHQESINVITDLRLSLTWYNENIAGQYHTLGFGFSWQWYGWKVCATGETARSAIRTLQYGGYVGGTLGSALGWLGGAIGGSPTVLAIYLEGVMNRCGGSGFCIEGHIISRYPRFTTSCP